MTFEKAFDSIKKKFADADAKNISDFALQVTLSDEDCCGTFYIEVKGGVLAVEPYDYRDNNAVLDILKSDFISLISGKKSIEKAVEGGASLKGDAAVIESIKAMLPAKKAAAKKAPAKKTAAAKKAPVKKAAAAKKAPAAKKAAPAKKTAAAAKKAVEKAPAKTVKKTEKAAETKTTAAKAPAKAETAKKTTK